MKLLEPLAIGSVRAPNRLLFGPHVTNLADGRSISDRHAAYYRSRAVGGCGTIVIEEAAVHPSDWPYERSPLADEAGPGWSAVAEACAETDALIIAAIGHSGGQGSSAYSQRELWAPSDEPEVNSREVPKVMESEDIAAVLEGFTTAAALASASGLHGVEVNAGQHSLIRQFLSGLTNRRSDEYGTDRLRFAREAIRAARRGLGIDGIIGLRLSCDEMAPWAGITPEVAAEIAAELAPLVDYLVVVRGAIFTVAETRPTGHHGTGFNLDLVGAISSAVDGPLPLFAQGSIVDPGQAEWAIDDGRCDGVEMTRAQIADPELGLKLATGRAVRPCVLCNQRCQVRDNRNPIVSCIAEPRAGFETIDPHPEPQAGDTDIDTTPGPDLGPVLVVGAGPGGLEAARVAARNGAEVTVIDRRPAAGGLLPTIARLPGNDRFAALAEWLEADAREAGVTFRLGEEATTDLLDGWPGPVILATGARPVPTADSVFPDTTQADASKPDTTEAGASKPDITEAGASKVDAAEDAPASGLLLLEPIEVLEADDAALEQLVPARVAVWDPVGNSVGVGIAEMLADRGRAVTFVTPDAVAGTLLSLTGDLAGCNVRLQQRGVAIERRQRPVGFDGQGITTEHLFTAARVRFEVHALIDCGPRLSDETLLNGLDRPIGPVRVGDAIAARTVGEAIREGREAAVALLAGSTSRPSPRVTSVNGTR